MSPRVRQAVHEAAFLVGALLAASVISYVLTKLLTGAWAF